MDSFCDNLIVTIFRFVDPDDRFRFIMLGKKYYNAVSNYITTPEWIYEQIDQFIKKNVIRNFSLRNDAPNEYGDYAREHKRDTRIRSGNYDDISLAADDNSSECTSAHDSECGRRCYVSINKIVQQLGIGVMKCLYADEVDDCNNCNSCEWAPEVPLISGWNLDFIQNAPPNCSLLSDQDYLDYVTDCLKKQLDVKYYAYWSVADNHASNIIIIGRDEVVEYTHSDTCIGNSVMPIHSVYESIGIIVHNMTGIEQIHRNLFDYDIEHLQLFYIVNFLASHKIPDMSTGPWRKQGIDVLRYSLFVERVLRDCICKNVEMLLMMNRTGSPKYIFMIHPEIELKAAESAEHIIVFGTE